MYNLDRLLWNQSVIIIPEGYCEVPRMHVPFARSALLRLEARLKNLYLMSTTLSSVSVPSVVNRAQVVSRSAK